MRRREALALGLVRYSTGKPCRAGHISERYTKYGGCVKCSADSTKRYSRAHPDRVKRSMTAWRNKNPMDTFLRNSLKRLENPLKLTRLRDVEEILGYSQRDFISHIEALWEDGMSWLNRSEWHIDHIKPINVFLSNGITDIQVVNALSNLRPMWAENNRKKGGKFEKT